MSFAGENILAAGDAGKKQYYGIDITKTIMAFFVIMVHRTPFSNADLVFGAKNILGRLAVPFFFAAAGFLFFNKRDVNSQESNKKFFRYIKRLIILYIVWTVMYMPAAAYRFDFEKYGVIKFILNYAKRSLLEVSIIHLWYLLALIVAIFILFLLSKRLGKGLILGISAVLFYMYILVTELLPLTGKIPGFAFLNKLIFAIPVAGIKDGVFIGFIFVALGAFTATRKISMSASVKYSVTGICIVLFFAEALLRRHFGYTDYLEVTIMQVPVTFMLLVCAFQAELKPRKIYGIMRQTNALIYFSHLLIITEWYNLIFAGTALEHLSQNPAFFFFFTLLYTLAFSFAVVWLEKKKPFGFLKYIH